MNMYMKNKIGHIYENLVEMQEDLEVELEGEVFFSDIEKVPFSPSVRCMEFYNDADPYEGYTVEFVLMDEDATSWDESPIKLIDIYGL